MATHAPITGAPTRAPATEPSPRRRAPRYGKPRDRRDAPATPPTAKAEDPATFPRIYASGCVGTCLEPVLHDGCTLVFDKEAEVQAGDFVAVFLKQEAIRPGAQPRMVKRLALGLMPGLTFPYVEHPNSTVRPLVVLETLNPPRQFMVPVDQITAMHRCIGEAETTGPGLCRMTARFGAGGEREVIAA